MSLFNRVLASIVALALILASAALILYLIGVLANAPALTVLVRDTVAYFSRLSPSAQRAWLIVTFIAALALFVLEVRPFKPAYITVRESELGTTLVRRSDVERYLLDRLSVDLQRQAVTPTDVDVEVHGYMFDVGTDLEIPSIADRQAVRERVEKDIKESLSAIGLEDELEWVNARVARIKRVA